MSEWPQSLVKAGNALDEALTTGDVELIDGAKQHFCEVLADVGPGLPANFPVGSLQEWMEKRGFTVGRR